MAKVETWLKIDYSDKYFISNLGRVKSLKTNKILKQQKTRDGYAVVSLSVSRKIKKTFRVHRLVLEAFKPTEVKMTVNHINCVRDDNRLENLEWLPHKENVRHSSKQGKYSRFGHGNSRSKLSPEDVKIIRSRYDSGEIVYRIWKDFKHLTYACIMRCAKRETYVY